MQQEKRDNQHILLLLNNSSGLTVLHFSVEYLKFAAMWFAVAAISAYIWKFHDS